MAILRLAHGLKRPIEEISLYQTLRVTGLGDNKNDRPELVLNIL